MNELLKFGKAVLNDQPFSQWMGAELSDLREGKAELVLKIKEEHKQQHGFVHGGVISYLADNCLTFAAGSVLGNSVTSEYKINYLKPGIGSTLIARATVISCGKTQAVCECKIFSEKEQVEKLIAVAQGTINKVSS